MRRSELENEDRTPDELREAAADCRERAERAAEVEELASAIASNLRELIGDDYLTDRARYQLDLLKHQFGAIRHGEQWGYDAHYSDEHAHRLEWRADAIEAEREHDHE